MIPKLFCFFVLGADSGVGGKGAKLWISSGISSTMCMVSILKISDRLIQNLKKFFDPPPLPWGQVQGGGARGQSWISSGISWTMCVVSIPRLFVRLIQNPKEFFDPAPLGADSGGGARGQRGETSLAYLKPCVWCLYLGYLIGWFRIWKNFFDPAPLGADSEGGGTTLSCVLSPSLYPYSIQDILN